MGSSRIYRLNVNKPLSKFSNDVQQHIVTNVIKNPSVPKSIMSPAKVAACSEKVISHTVKKDRGESNAPIVAQPCQYFTI